MIFWKEFNNLFDFIENLGKILENFGNMHLWRCREGAGGGGRALELGKLKNLVEKSNRNLQHFQSFHELW